MKSSSIKSRCRMELTKEVLQPLTSTKINIIYPKGTGISIAPNHKSINERDPFLKHNIDQLVNLPHRYREVQRTAERDSTQGLRNRSMRLSHSFHVFMLDRLIFLRQ